MNFNAQCVACNSYIHGAPVKVGNTNYHAKCFVCHSCNAKLQVVSYKQNKGTLYCEHCYKVSLRSVVDSQSALANNAVAPTRTPPVTSGSITDAGGGAFCGSCGARATTGANFCSSCGARMS
jgi:predicted amidophosphoribosyltransferase